VGEEPTRPDQMMPDDVNEPARLPKLAAEAAKDLADAAARDVIVWAAETFRDRVCVTSSMTDAVVIHLAASVKPGMDVIFLDTGYHFPETIGIREAVGALYPVNLISVTPARTVAEQDAELGPRLYGRNPDLCCYLRKVVPLERALDPYDAWITGVRREETSARSDTRVVEWDGRRAVVKVNPIASWTQEQVEAYIAENDVLVNPLLDDGYPSIGCAPCTMRVKPGADPRSGRWAGIDKTECGLHH
jgi:phosphoadenosine phosphosulfate reductase